MSGSELRERHLTREEIIARVFPIHEGAIPVPLHLSVCPECASKVDRLREAWLLDRGAVEGVMEEIPPAFWDEQAAATMVRVRDEAEAASRVTSFPLRWKATMLRRPALAAASLAAALLLVAGVTVFRPRPSPPGVVTPPAEATAPGGFASPSDARDDELIRSVDQVLSDEIPFRSLIPEEV